ncbi:MAG: bifunctional demethylmenaquinone methyltransferase/2-methoxy-6-polyprenyl-1,4-benzoquinol methylase UbiE [Bacteroidales bacterium]|nr:bifunctional demethylmenaquinone methyltransferase/2-methoxy-6-polyprenyl-1,4-benzoquinol methylase UbiE [Bacteroidales bacterium]
MNININKEREKISSMFNNIAGSYDLLNHLLSFGIDKRWRKRLIGRVLLKNPKTVLDIACGTGDLTLALFKKGIQVTGLDIAQKMMDVAQEKLARHIRKTQNTSLPNPIFVCASAESIPFENSTFDAVTIGFGIRNFENRGESLLEISRVLKKGGTLAILEFATPKNKIWRWLFNLYFLKILPFIGKIISKDNQAYSYLPQSVSTFPQYEEFASELEHFGYVNIDYITLTGGVAILYVAQKK